MKAIFLDIDGTLVEPGHHEPPASAVKAIELAQKAGHKVFLCTGRNRGMLAPLLRYPFDGVIGSSGGYVTCGDTVVYDRPMTDAEAHRLLEVLDRNGVFYTVECRANSYTDDRFKSFLRSHAGEGNNSELLRWQEQIEHSLGVLPLTEWQGKPVYKMVITCERREQLDEPLALLSDTFGFCIQDPRPGGFVNGEVQHIEFDKGTAVRQICDFLGIPVSDSIGFGDSMNDLQMIQTVGFGVCMANGSETLKKESDMVCPSVTEDGLYQAFEKLGLLH